MHHGSEFNTDLSVCVSVNHCVVRDANDVFIALGGVLSTEIIVSILMKMVHA